MKSQTEIQDKLKKILADERLSYPSANIQINAPLALIQLELETKRDTLRWVLADTPGQKYALPDANIDVTKLVGDLNNVRTSLVNDNDPEKAADLLDFVLNELGIAARNQREAANGI